MAMADLAQKRAGRKRRDPGCLTGGNRRAPGDLAVAIWSSCSPACAVKRTWSRALRGPGGGYRLAKGSAPMRPTSPRSCWRWTSRSAPPAAWRSWVAPRAACWPASAASPTACGKRWAERDPSLPGLGVAGRRGDGRASHRPSVGDVAVPGWRGGGMSARTSIYLDYNATAPGAAGGAGSGDCAPWPSNGQSLVGPRGRPGRGRPGRTTARFNEVGELVGAARRLVVFNSGGTEANAPGHREREFAAGCSGV